jgi:hypothetical protein
MDAAGYLAGWAVETIREYRENGRLDEGNMNTRMNAGATCAGQCSLIKYFIG